MLAATVLLSVFPCSKVWWGSTPWHARNLSYILCPATMLLMNSLIHMVAISPDPFSILSKLIIRVMKISQKSRGAKKKWLSCFRWSFTKPGADGPCPWVPSHPAPHPHIPPPILHKPHWKLPLTCSSRCLCCSLAPQKLGQHKEQKLSPISPTMRTLEKLVQMSSGILLLSPNYEVSGKVRIEAISPHVVPSGGSTNLLLLVHTGHWPGVRLWPFLPLRQHLVVLFHGSILPCYCFLQSWIVFSHCDLSFLK